MTMKTQAINSRLITLALAAAVTGAVMFFFSASAEAGEKGRDDPAQAVLEDRLRQHCKSLVKNWLHSTGINDPAIQEQSAACYLSHVRLAIMGVDWNLDLTDASISEVPGRILESRTGISLDLYSRLAGRSFNAPEDKAGQTPKMPTITTGAAGGEVQ